MKFPPIYIKTEEVGRLLHELEVLKEAFALQPMPEREIKLLRAKSILKSALFSARIEGNPLTLNDVKNFSGHEDVHTQEVTNLARAYDELSLWGDREISIDLLKSMHGLVMKGLGVGSGLLRLEESAIFNAAGVAVYLTPAPGNIRTLLEACIDWIRLGGHPSPVVAGMAHYWFEKIHPFDDGNGRVGRLLSTLLLTRGGYGFASIIPFEEYLETHRDQYYAELGKDRQDATSFVEFFLTSLVSQVRLTLASIRDVQPNRLNNLLPRRAEIVEIIRDHTMVSFDFLARRFRRIPARTLHHDLAQLVKVGYVKKLGATRGAQYVLGDG